MWYDNDQTVKDVVKGVVDVQYRMDGRIERTLQNGKKYTIVEQNSERLSSRGC